MKGVVLCERVATLRSAALAARGVDLDAEVQLHELVEAAEHTGAGDAAQDVGAGALHERHEALLLHDLHEAVDGAVVLLGLAARHHHAPPNGVHRVGDEARHDRHSVAERERRGEARVVAEQDGLERVVEAEVAAAVDDDAHAADDEAAVEAADASVASVLR